MKSYPLFNSRRFSEVLAVACVLFASVNLYGQANATQAWTGLNPPPANGTSYNLTDISDGFWDNTANWANHTAGTATDYYSLLTGAGRVALFQTTGFDYTVTIAQDYTPPPIRALQVSGGVGSGTVTIRSQVAKEIWFSGASGAYVNVVAGRELVLGENVALRIVISGDSFNKIGAGTMRWKGNAATYNQKIGVNAGLFVIDTDASSRLSGDATVTLGGGEFRYDGDQALAASVVINSGILSGTGTIGTAVTIGNGAIIAPGSGGNGIQQYANLTFASGGTYMWEISSWSGSTAGVDFDQIHADMFAVTSTAGAQFVLSLAANRTLTDFNAYENRSWVILTADSTSLMEIDPLILVDASEFAASYDLKGGEFSLSWENQNLELVYTAIPEPSAFALLGTILLLFSMYRLRRIR